MNSILGSIDIGWNKFFTSAERGGMLNEAWSMISEKDRQALNAAGFNINNQIPGQSQQAKKIANKSSVNSKNNMLRNIDQNFIDGLGDIVGELIAQTKQNVLSINSTNNQPSVINQNLADEKRFIENIAGLFMSFYNRNGSNNFPYTSEEINNITNYLYDIANDQTVICTIYNLPSAINFIAEQTIDNFNALAKSLNDMMLNRNGPVPSLDLNYQFFK